jgi:hypothetical protein
MRDRILAAILTFAVFAAGFGAGLWAERHRPIPPPPDTFMGEFGPRVDRAPKPPAVNRAQLSEEIANLRPEMDNFRSRIADIYSQFDRDIEGILTPQQKAKYLERFKGRRNAPLPEVGTGDGTLSDQQIEALLQRPFRTLAFFVVVPMTLEHMANELKLDEAQREKVRDLLRVRREKFIELVDGAPPPSLELSRLAPLAQRIGAPTAVPSGAAK